MAARKAHEDELNAIVEGWCETQDAAEAETALCSLGVSAARVVSLYDVYDRPNPLFEARGFVEMVDHPETGPQLLAGAPWTLARTPAEPLRPAPCLGEHSYEVLTQELGITDEEYRELVAAGVTGTLND